MTRDDGWLLKYEQGQKNTYTWEPNGHILSDNDWKYKVGGIVPRSNLPALSRTNAAGQSESVSIATRTGTIIETNLQGVATTTQIFRAPGPYFNKVREITQTANGVTQVLERRSYDEAGRLIRSLDPSGTITAFTYDAAGKLVHQATALDPKVLAQLRQQEAAMLKVIAATPTENKEALLYKLGLFYMQEMRNYPKAQQLAATIHDDEDSYIISLFAIAYDPAFSDTEKIASYQKLLVRYPQKQKFTNSMIEGTKRNLNRG